MATDRFEPAMYSLEVNAFLIEHAGEPPEKAFEKGLPGQLVQQANPNPNITAVTGMREVGTSRADVWPIIERLYRLRQQELHQGLQWCGLDAVKQSCRRYLAEKAKWALAQTRGGPAEPSRYAWDGMGRGHLNGVGSDSSYVKTYFDERGNRFDLGVDFFPGGVSEYVPEWVSGQPGRLAAAKPEFTDFDDDPENGVITCPICRFSQTYMVGSAARRNMARARVGKHLVTAKKNPEAHRQLHSFIFGGADVTVRS